MKPNRPNTTTNRAGRGDRGFSLVELLVVVAVILIIMAIAIPNFIQSRIRANESAAAQNLRDIVTAEVIYSTTYGIGFSPDLPSLGGNGGVSASASQADLIDSVLAAGTKSGYNYTYTVVSQDSASHVVDYAVNADPLSVGNSGYKHFYSDQTAVIRFNNTAPAGSSDAPI